MERKQYFGGVDVVRFVAALLVMFFHLGWQLWLPDPAAELPLYKSFSPASAPIPAMWFGAIGVHIFFVISGLVIANSALTSTPIAFAKHRIYRLYPAAWICAAVGAFIFVLYGMTHDLGAQFLGSAMLWPAGPWLAGVYWTIVIELIFYAAVFSWKLILPAAPLEWLAPVILVVTIVYYISRLAKLDWLLALVDYAHFPSYGAFFALGIYIWLRTQRDLRASEWVLSAISLCLCAAEIVHAYSDGSVLHRAEPLAAWMIAVACLMFGTSDIEALRQLPKRVIHTIRVIGLMTYPVYLIHVEVGTACMRVLLSARMPGWLAALCAALVVIVFAYCIVMFAEPVVRRILRALIDGGEARFIQGRRAFGMLYRVAPKPSVES